MKYTLYSCMYCPINFPKAETNAFKISETAIINPILNIKENESSLVIINCHQIFFGFTLNPQILLMESCISPNMLVAPINKTTIPITDAKNYFPLREYFLWFPVFASLHY